MSAWVLLVTIFFTTPQIGGVTSQTIEFKSSLECEKAQQIIARKVEGKYTIVVGVCVEKKK